MSRARALNRDDIIKVDDFSRDALTVKKIEIKSVDGSSSGDVIVYVEAVDKKKTKFLPLTYFNASSYDINVLSEVFINR